MAFALGEPTAAEIAEIEQHKAQIRAEQDQAAAEADARWHRQREREAANTFKGRDSILKLNRDARMLALEARAAAREKEKTADSSPQPARICPKCGHQITSIRNRCYACDPGTRPGPKPKPSAPVPAPVSQPRPRPAPLQPASQPAPVRADDIMASIASEAAAVAKVAAALEGLDPESVQWVLAPFIRRYHRPSQLT